MTTSDWTSPLAQQPSIEERQRRIATAGARNERGTSDWTSPLAQQPSIEERQRRIATAGARNERDR